MSIDCGQIVESKIVCTVPGDEPCNNLKKGQVSLEVENKFKVIVEMKIAPCLECGKPSKSFESFNKAFSANSKAQWKQKLTIHESNFNFTLQQNISCVSCRRSVESILGKAKIMDVFSAFDVSNGGISISQEYLNSSKKLHKLLYVTYPKLKEIKASIMSTKKNKRCKFHSMKMMKPNDLQLNDNKYTVAKNLGQSVIDVWDQCSKDCQKEITMLDCEYVNQTMDFYLKKHRFCSECKAKVMRAYHILTKEINNDEENGYCSAIYEGLKYCKESSHIHVCSERGFIAHMLTLADAEITGGRKERHAKTIDIAQEEVCTCLSLCLYNRLHKLWHTKLTFEQTWTIFVTLNLELIVKNFEMCVDQQSGNSSIQNILNELGEEAKQPQVTKSAKKKKNKKNKQKQKKREQMLAELESLEDNSEQTENCSTTPDENDSGAGEAPCTSCMGGLETVETPRDFPYYGKPDSLDNMLKCECFDMDGCPNEIPPSDIEIYKKKYPDISARRTRLYDRLKKDFQDYLLKAASA